MRCQPGVIAVCWILVQAGRSLMRGNIATPQPAPYVKPRREGQALNEEAAEVLEEEDEREKAGA